jgi:hypothetical protein
MELDDLKRRWEDLDGKLDASLRLNARLLAGGTLGKAETAMRRLARWLGIELLVDLVAALWLGSFLAEHAAQVRFLLPALVLDLGVIGLLIAAVRQLVAIHRLDWSAPVVAIQQRLESLRVERLATTRITLLLSPLLWTPLLIVGLESLLGVNAYELFSGAWLLANLLFGLAVIPIAIWASRSYADRLERSPLVRRLMRDLAGHNLNAASASLEELARFESEEAPA